MSSFRNRWFCPYWEKCEEGKWCQRALTPEVEEQAAKVGRFLDKLTTKDGLDCYRPKKKK
jgi:hypothetical protein